MDVAYDWQVEAAFQSSSSKQTSTERSNLMNIHIQSIIELFKIKYI